jgi:N utilization substance protein A
MLQLGLDSDAILALGGIGPKALDEIKSVISSIKFAVEEEMPVEPVPAVQEPEMPEEGIPIAIEPALALEAPVEFAPEVDITEVEVEPEGEAPEVVEPTEPAIAEGSSAVSIEDEEKSLDSLFKLRPEVFTEAVSSDEEEDDELGPKKGAKAKKKKRKFTEMEYDPDRDVMVVKKKKKRGTGDWENWDF